MWSVFETTKNKPAHGNHFSEIRRAGMWDEYQISSRVWLLFGPVYRGTFFALFNDATNV